MSFNLGSSAVALAFRLRHARPSRIGLALAAVVALILAVTSLLAPLGQLVIRPGDVRVLDGRAFITPISLEPPLGLVFLVASDDGLRPYRSELVLLEDGRPLGPAHSVHAEVVERGAGRYSHWSRHLIFSTADGSDPRSNGRAYSIRAPSRLATWLVAVQILALAYLGWGLWRRLADFPLDYRLAWARRVALISGMGLVAYVNYAGFAVGPLWPCFAPDSFTYINFSSNRTIGYPLFLALLRSLFGDFAFLPFLQVNILLASFAVLAYACAKVTRSSMLGLGLFAIIVLNPDVMIYGSMVLTEALFISLLALHIAAAILSIERPTPARLFAAGLTAALAVLVRPAGYFLLATLPLLVALIAPRRTRAAVVVLAGFAPPLIAASGIHLVRYGDFATQSVGGFSLFGQVLPLLPYTKRSSHPDLVADLNSALKPHLSDLPANRFSEEYRNKTSERWNALTYGVAAPILGRYVYRFDRRDQGTDSSTLGNKIAGEVAMDAIRAAPLAYAEHVLSHAYGLWAQLFSPSYQLRNHRLDCAAGNAKFAAVVPDHQRVLIPRPRADAESWLKDYPGAQFTMGIETFRAVLAIPGFAWVTLGMAGGIIAVAAALACRGRNRLLGMSAYCAAVVWAYFLLVAALQPAIPRYAHVADMAFWSGLALGGFVLLEAIRGRLDRRVDSASGGDPEK